MTTIHLDFETRSAAELRDVGVYVYADHPSTDVWCMAWAVDDGPVRLWQRILGHSRLVQPGFPQFQQLLKDPQTVIVAHNAQFEHVIWNSVMTRRYGWPELPVEKMRCTMAAAYAMSLPGSLDQAGAALGLDSQKDMAGHRLMLQMARPRKVEADGTITWWDEPEKLQRLYDYCKRDVEVERLLDKRLRQLSPSEHRIWLLDQNINRRGVAIDKTLCLRAQRVVERATRRLDDRMIRVTEGGVTAVSNVQQLASWVRKQGVDTKSLSKDTIVDLLEEWDLPPAVETALELRQEGGKTSTAKIQSFLDYAGKDGRCRGLLQYHGAGTGRWAGRGPQVQNLPRPKLKQGEIEEAIDLIMHGKDDLLEMLFGGVPGTVADCIRGMIVPGDGKTLFSADFANIEGRVLAWWADERWKLRAFRDYDTITGKDAKGKPIRKGPDLYKVAASGIFGVPVDRIDDDRRQIGKVSELALGYQGGVGAFVQMAKTYGLKIEKYHDIIVNAAKAEHHAQAEEMYGNQKNRPPREVYIPAEIVKLAWRENHPNVGFLWPKCEEAVLEAVRKPGAVYAVNGVRWRVNGSFLWCALPRGRVICYPYPRIADKETPWGAIKETVFYKGVDSRTRKWGDQHLYGGKIVENVVQAIARDVMAEAMVRVEDAGYEVVMTIHDEVVVERAGGDVEEFKTLMATLPAWARGLPVAVEGWMGRRYRK